MRTSVRARTAESCRVSLPEAVPYPLEWDDGRSMLRHHIWLSIVAACASTPVLDFTYRREAADSPKRKAHVLAQVPQVHACPSAVRHW
jgi:hypothetical protein